MARRKEKVNELLRDVISEIIQRDVKDPRLGLLTVTEVEVAPDLSSARVFISVLGSDDQQKDSLVVLQKAKGYIRTEVARRVRSLRHVPELIFKSDESIKTGIRMHELLGQIKQEDEERQSQSAPQTEDAEQRESADDAETAPARGATD